MVNTTLGRKRPGNSQSAESHIEPQSLFEFRALWQNWAFFAVCFAVAAFWFLGAAVSLVPSDRVRTIADRIFIACPGVASALFAWWLAWNAGLRRGVVVRLTPEGITDNRIAKCEIPWPEVTGCELVRDRDVSAVRVKLSPRFAFDRFEANARPLYRLRRVLGEPGALVSVEGLHGTNLRHLGSTIACFVQVYGRSSPMGITAVSHDVVQSKTDRTFNLPIAAVVMCMVLAIVYLAESGSIGLKPDATTLLGFGALARENLIDGEWWRLVTAPLLHASPSHLISNVIALFIVGRVLEPLIGSGRLLLTFTVCALAGGFASAFLSSTAIVSVGASGGIMGLLTLAAVMAFRYPSSARRSNLLTASVMILLPTLLAPLASKGGKIDVMAHLGGFMMGLLVSLAIHLPRAKEGGDSHDAPDSS